jgi:hypothetical protein
MLIGSSAKQKTMLIEVKCDLWLSYGKEELHTAIFQGKTF